MIDGGLNNARIASPLKNYELKILWILGIYGNSKQEWKSMHCRIILQRSVYMARFNRRVMKCNKKNLFPPPQLIPVFRLIISIDHLNLMNGFKLKLLGVR